MGLLVSYIEKTDAISQPLVEAEDSLRATVRGLLREI